VALKPIFILRLNHSYSLSPLSKDIFVKHFVMNHVLPTKLHSVWVDTPVISELDYLCSIYLLTNYGASMCILNFFLLTPFFTLKSCMILIGLLYKNTHSP